MAKVTVDFSGPNSTLWSGICAALAFYIYDILITFDDEVELIWQKSNSSWIKWTYLFMRYFSLIIQVTNFALFAEFESVSIPPDDPIRKWFTFQCVISWLLMTAVEAILMSRVYALYMRSRLIAATFVVLLLFETAATIIGIVRIANRGDEGDFLHLLIAAPQAFEYLGFVAISSQIIVLLLTVARYRKAVVAEKTLTTHATPANSLARAPIMLLTIRDGTYAFLVLFLMSTLTVTYTQVGYLQIYAAVLYTWLLVTISSAGCRLIINMQKLPTKGMTSASETIHGDAVELTTLGPDFMSLRTAPHAAFTVLSAESRGPVGTTLTEFDVV